MRTTRPDRLSIAYVIIYCHLTLIGLIVLLFISGGILQEELTPLMSLLLPITTVYGGSVFNHIADSIKGRMESSDSMPHARLVKRLVFLHFALMLLLICCKTVFNWLEFSAMLTLMTLLEASFGGYMGVILNAVFTSDKTGK